MTPSRTSATTWVTVLNILAATVVLVAGVISITTAEKRRSEAEKLDAEQVEKLSAEMEALHEQGEKLSAEVEVLHEQVEQVDLTNSALRDTISVLRDSIAGLLDLQSTSR